jgi:hypothetical protein
MVLFLLQTHHTKLSDVVEDSKERVKEETLIKNKVSEMKAEGVVLILSISLVIISTRTLHSSTLDAK